MDLQLIPEALICHEKILKIVKESFFACDSAENILQTILWNAV